MGSTSAALKQFRGISDAGVFFEQVMSKPYLNQVPDKFCVALFDDLLAVCNLYVCWTLQVVAAPHVYPPSITKARDK